MVTEKMEVLYSKLAPIAPPGVQTSRVKQWIAFQVQAPKGIRNAVTIRSEGVSFFTEDTLLLDELSKQDLKWRKLFPDKGRSRLRYRFTNLTPDLLDKHMDDFRKLFEESVRLKLYYS
jgi:hypothetical protein